MFEYAWKFALKWEGGLTDDKYDPGGITNYGVDIAMLRDMELVKSKKEFLRALGVRLPVDRETIKRLTKAQAAEIYRFQVWSPLECWRYADPVGVVLFDAGMNNGNGNSVKFIQRAHNDLKPNSKLTVDGALGPKTRQAILSDDPNKLAKLAIDRREYFFRSLVKVKPKMQKFLKGWTNRTADLRKYLNLK